MNAFKSLLLLALFSSIVLAEDSVYLCRKDGKVLYSSTEEQGYDCKPLSLNLIERTPEELERLERERDRRADLDRQRREELRMERMIEAREDEALATRREARAREAQAQFMLELLQLELFERELQDHDHFLFLGPGFRDKKKEPRTQPPERPDSLLNPPLPSGTLLNPPPRSGSQLNPNRP